MRSGTLQYLVKRKGCDVSENSWPTKQDLSNEPETLDAFRRRASQEGGDVRICPVNPHPRG